jgi:hypothetical protein
MAISRISRLQIHAVDCKNIEFNALLTQQKKVIRLFTGTEYTTPMSPVPKPNSRTYNFVEVSGNNRESSQT